MEAFTHSMVCLSIFFIHSLIKHIVDANEILLSCRKFFFDRSFICFINHFTYLDAYEAFVVMETTYSRCFSILYVILVKM